VRRIEKGAACVATDDDNTSDAPAMRPVGLDLDDPGNPFPRFGLVLVVILAAFIISGIDERWAQVVGLGLTALLTIVTYREAYFPKRVGHVVIVGSIALVAAIAIGMMREASSWRAVPMFVQAALLAWLVVMLVRAALRSKVVDIQTILAAISAYMVIGLAYSWLYLGMEVVAELATEPVLRVQLHRADHRRLREPTPDAVVLQPPRGDSGRARPGVPRDAGGSPRVAVRRCAWLHRG
jgi:hypothetical protein